MSNAPQDALDALETAFESAALDDIKTQLATLEKDHGDDILVQVGRARLTAAEGNPDAARAALEKLAKQKGRGADVARAYFGSLLHAAGEHKKAVSQIQTALKAGADVPAARHALGAALLTLGKYQEALPHLEKAAEAMPSSAVTFYYLGQGFEMARDFARAGLAYANCVKVAPTFPDAFESLVRAHALSGDLAAAARAVDEGLKHRPGDVALMRLRVTVAADRGDLKGAKAAIMDIPAGQQTAEDLANLALICLQDGAVDEAGQHAQSAVDKDPSFWRGHHLVGVVAEAKDPEGRAGARAAYEAAVSAGDPFGESSARLGWLMLSGDPSDPKSAAQILSAALQKTPDHPALQWHLALANRELGDKTAAQKLAKAVLNNPRSSEKERGQAQKLLDADAD